MVFMELCFQLILALLDFKHIHPARHLGIWGLPRGGFWLRSSGLPRILSVGSILSSLASVFILLAASPLEGE